MCTFNFSVNTLCFQWLIETVLVKNKSICNCTVLFEINIVWIQFLCSQLLSFIYMMNSYFKFLKQHQFVNLLWPSSVQISYNTRHFKGFGIFSIHCFYSSFTVFFVFSHQSEFSTTLLHLILLLTLCYPTHKLSPRLGQFCQQSASYQLISRTNICIYTTWHLPPCWENDHLVSGWPLRSAVLSNIQSPWKGHGGSWLLPIFHCVNTWAHSARSLQSVTFRPS